jgi:hypothetical protein
MPKPNEDDVQDQGADDVTDEPQSEPQDDAEPTTVSAEDFEKLEKKLADLEKERNSERSRADKLHSKYEKLLKQHESEEERREREKQEREELLSEREKLLQEKEVRFIKLNVMREFGIPAEHESRIHGSDEDSIREDAKTYKAELDRIASILTNEKLAGGQPPKDGESKKGMAYEQFKKLSRTEQVEWMNEHPDDWQQLLK